MAYENYAEVKAKKPVKWWHEAIIDDMLAFPLDTLKQRGERLGYDPAYLSVIINSDMFKAVYTQRRADYSTRLDDSITNKTAQVAGKCLDIMLETLEAKRGAIPFAVLSDSSNNLLSKLGYGVKPQGAAVNLQVNGNGAQVAILPPVSAEQLAEARQALRNAEQLRALEPPGPERPSGNPPVLELSPTPEPGER